MSGQCPRCKRHLILVDVCNCQRFEVQQPWRGAASEGNWCEVYAYDAEAAAERFAEQSDSDGDYTIIQNGSAEMWVRDADDNVTRWSIEAESVPEYRAYELEFPAATESGFPVDAGAAK
jgi:hypothetical protein